MVLGVLGWALFAAGWWLTISRGRVVSSHVLLALPLAAVVVMAVTGAWIRHNRAIFRRKGPRRSIPPSDFDWRFDRLGRIVLADDERIGSARVTVVSVSDSFKRFDAES